MKTATITQVKNGLSAIIDRVRAGETILITDRGLAVARLEPIAALPDPSGRLGRLERAGVLRVGMADPPLARLRRPPPALAEGTSAVRVVLEERRAGR